jgi:hypothetical protein
VLAPANLLKHEDKIRIRQRSGRVEEPFRRHDSQCHENRGDERHNGFDQKMPRSLKNDTTDEPNQRD